jgi:carbonic anhydrase
MNSIHPGTKAKAKVQAALLAESSTVIKGLVKEGKLKVTAGYYDIATRSVMLLD